MRFAYCRVSTADQNLQNQREELKQKNIDTWFEEKISGATMERPQLMEMLKHLREGDEIYVVAWDRLARNLKHLIEIVEIIRDKKAKLISLKEGVCDPNTAIGKLLIAVTGMIAEFERDKLKERQKIGIETTKKFHPEKYAGRKPVERPDEFNAVYDKQAKKEITHVQAMKYLGLKKTTYFKMVNSRKKEIEKEEAEKKILSEKKKLEREIFPEAKPDLKSQIFGVDIAELEAESFLKTFEK